MDPARWKQIDELVDMALGLPADERESFVIKRAGDDLSLRKAVFDLLSGQQDSDADFLSHSAMRVAAKAAAENEDIHTSAFAFINKTIATYRVERLLGIGGMGEVYLAFDEKLNRKVALKLLPAEYVSNDERVKRFEVEARAIAKLNHPGIVTVFDVGNFEGVNYIATEFVEGKTLRELMGGKFKIRNIVLNSIQICDALSAAHKEGIIHRDIKPENIMIRKDGYAKILDFGLAKLTDLTGHTIRDFTATTKGVIIGTPAYMSPAQISDESVDHRTDLWSAGVVLYEFLTGKNPFKGANRQETFQAVLSKQLPPCSSLNPDVPPALDEILAKLLDKDREKSYQSASALRSDLKKVERDFDSSPSWSSGSSSRLTAANRSKVSYFVYAFIALVIIALLGAAYYFYSSSRVTGAINWRAAKSVPLTDQPGIEYYPSNSPDGKDFVYAAQENGVFHIFSQRIGSKKRDDLTPGATTDNTQPAFSPKGETIAFRSERDPKGIYVMNATGENLRQVSDFGFHPSWAPDGKEIVVASFGRDQPTTRATPGTSTLTIINISTRDKREIAKVEASFPAWSPNGHRIA